MLKNAPYKFSEFKSFTIKYGTPDSMLNIYDSKTGDYQYLNRHDSLVKLNMPLGTNNLLYLHRRAADIGFWDFPAVELNSDSAKFAGHKTVRYYIEFNYERKSKKVLFDESFNGDTKLKDANKELIDEITKMLNDVEEKRKKL